MSQTRTITKRNSSNRSNSPGATTAQLTSPQQAALTTGFDNIFNDFRRSFNELTSPFFTGLATTPLSQLPVRYPIVDLIDAGDNYVLTAELPGFSKDQIDLQMNKYGLVIHAEQQPQHEQTQSEQKSASNWSQNYLWRERAYSAFERVIEFPEEVVPQKVDATMKDGVLQVIVPKKEPAPEERLTKVQLK
jgi:HSP20 family protein